MPGQKYYILPNPPEGEWPVLKDPWARYWSHSMQVNKSQWYNVSYHNLFYN